MAKRRPAPKKEARPNGANLGFEAKLWQAADKLRGHMDAAEYKHVVLGLIFLKYISDAFQERYEALKKEPHADPEDRDEYAGENVFWVPKKARWSHLQDNAKQAAIGKLIDDAMDAIEKENPSLKGVLQKDYNRSSLDKHRLGELIDLVGTIGLGDKESRSKDILGRVYEYFLGQFASAEGKKGGEFYTPRCIVKLLVEMIEPFKGRVYDPCCGSSGMFVQSVEFIEAHASGNGNGGRARRDLSIYGQESNPTTWKLAKMNLAIRGIEANLGPHHADTFHNDLHKDLKADFILANPPFKMSDWGGQRVVVNNDPNPYKFTGKERDTETGLDNFGARYYSSSLARFLSVDPKARSARLSDPQTWNRYSYVRNNPLVFVDHDGEDLSLAPGLSKADQRRLTKALVENYRKPGGAQRIEALAKSDIKYTLGTGDLQGEGHGHTEARGTKDPKTGKVERSNTTVTMTIDFQLIDKDKKDEELGTRETAPPSDEQAVGHELVHADLFDANPEDQLGKTEEQKEKDAAPGAAQLDREKKGNKRQAEKRIAEILKQKEDK